MSLLEELTARTDAVASYTWLAGLLVTAYVLSAIWTWYPLRHVPGPWLASFSYLWLAYHHFRGQMSVTHFELRKYGRLVRTGPKYLVTDDLDIIRRATTARSRYGRDPWYTVMRFQRDRDNMFSQLSVVAHDTLKAKLTGAYNGRENPDLEIAIDSQIVRLLDLIRQKYLSSQVSLCRVDLAVLCRCFTLDVITRLAFGEALGHLDTGGDVTGWMSAIDSMIRVFGLTADMPLLRAFAFSRLAEWLGLLPKATDKDGVGKMMRFASSYFNARETSKRAMTRVSC
jgi:hypothetical protein